MKNLKETSVPSTIKSNKTPDVRFKDTFIGLKSHGMRQIRKALQDLEKGRFTF